MNCMLHNQTNYSCARLVHVWNSFVKSRYGDFGKILHFAVLTKSVLLKFGGKHHKSKHVVKIMTHRQTVCKDRVMTKRASMVSLCTLKRKCPSNTNKYSRMLTWICIDHRPFWLDQKEGW